MGAVPLGDHVRPLNVVASPSPPTLVVVYQTIPPVTDARFGSAANSEGVHAISLLGGAGHINEGIGEINRLLHEVAEHLTKVMAARSYTVRVARWLRVDRIAKLSCSRPVFKKATVPVSGG